jgi:Domain of Unknown Function with PDB structure (DUF3857)
VYSAQRHASRRFTPLRPWPYTACEAIVNVTRTFLSSLGVATLICFSGASNLNSRANQFTQQKPAEKSSEKTEGKSEAKPAPKIPAQIELLETRIRFEANGDSRKEVHAVVKINDELGVRQFARLNFDFNRAFEQVEIPLVRITHQSGGTADVLPSAITDTPNPAVVNAPAYQDVRVKSVRILGLEPGDSLEYRVVTTTTHHPLAPDFWFDHTFDRTGVVSHEIFELDLPATRMPKPDLQAPAPFTNNAYPWPEPDTIQLQVSPDTPVTTKIEAGNGETANVVYKWELTPSTLPHKQPDSEDQVPEPDIVLSTFHSWKGIAMRLGNRLTRYASNGGGTIIKKELELYRRPNPTEATYDFVSQKLTTIDLPLGSTGFMTRAPEEILSSGYATPEDKVALFSAIYRFTYKPFHVVVVCSGDNPESKLPRPSLLRDVLLEVTTEKSKLFLQPSLEVAPFGVVRADLRGKHALAGYQFFSDSADGTEWEKVTDHLPFKSFQHVNIDSAITNDGSLHSDVKYSMRGDNELLLRVAFHETAKEKWNEVAQLLALSDGFRGKISKAAASDPYETHDPFTVSYEVAQPKFLDWSKKPLRIPAILPLLGLPDPPAKTAPGASPTPIDLGTPLDVELSATIHLPAGTTAHIPTGTSVQRDFATYTSSYSAKDATLTATRHLNFILKEIPADHAADYNAFLRAVQNDESQFFTLERPEASAAKPQTP